MRPTPWLAALLPCFAVLWPIGSRAQPRAERVVVVRADDIEAARTGERLADALVARLARAGHPARRPSRPPEPAPIASLVTAARDAYANLRPREALAATGEALEIVDERGAVVTDRSDLVALLLLRAMAALAAGVPDAADAALDQVLAIDPAIELDPASYAPQVRERLAERHAQASEARHVLALEDLPPGATVRVDGEPVDGNRWELPAGTHRVAVRAPGRAPFGRTLTLERDETVTVEAPEEPERVLANPTSDTEMLVRAASEAGVELVLVEVRGSRIVVTGADGNTVRLNASEGGDVAALARQAERALTGRAERVPTPRAPPAEDEGPSPVPWLVAGGAVAVVGAVVVTVLVLSSGNGAEGGRWTR